MAAPPARAQIDHYERSLAELDLPGIRLALVSVLVATGSFARALEELESLLDADPLTPEAWRLYVEVSAGLGREVDARAFVERCRRATARIAFEDDAELIAELEALAEGRTRRRLNTAA